MVCAGCERRCKGCSVGCMDYLIESLIQPKEMKVRDNFSVYKNYRTKTTNKQHTYIR